MGISNNTFRLCLALVAYCFVVGRNLFITRNSLSFSAKQSLWILRFGTLQRTWNKLSDVEQIIVQYVYVTLLYVLKMAYKYSLTAFIIFCVHHVQFLLSAYQEYFKNSKDWLTCLQGSLIWNFLLKSPMFLWLRHLFEMKIPGKYSKLSSQACWNNQSLDTELRIIWSEWAIQANLRFISPPSHTGPPRQFWKTGAKFSVAPPPT